MALSVTLIAAIAVGDYFTGSELSFSVFYLAPISLGTWFAGPGPGLALAVVSALTWLGVDAAGGHVYAHRMIPVWNMLVRFAYFVITLSLLSKLKTSYSRQAAMARTDSLTGAANSRTFGDAARNQMERARRHGLPFAVAYLDIDDFKRANDTLGHRVGDTILMAVADTMRQSLRSFDVVARLGGDEFAAILVDAGPEAAQSACDRLRLALASTMEQNGWPPTFSIGLAIFLEPPASVDAMIAEADRLMYQAKNGGKNTMVFGVVGAGPAPPERAAETAASVRRA